MLKMVGHGLWVGLLAFLLVAVTESWLNFKVT